MLPQDYLERAPEFSLDMLRTAAAGCQACPLYEHATQTVFGEGSPAAAIVLVGEQPGDREDVAGRPFVGPAGRVLDDALDAAGIDRAETYVTNAVKHFKFTQMARGKRRLHAKPNAGEIQACKPWVLIEILKVQPEVVVCLGATAAQALIRRDFRLTRERGLVKPCDLAPRVVATVHPSYLLRLPEVSDREREFARFVEDLRLAA